MAKLTKEAFVEALKSMTLLEIKELVDGIKEEFGVDPSSVMVASGSNADNANEQPEKTKFTVIMKSLGSANKVAIIKTIRQITNLGILEAKKLAENTEGPVIKQDINKAEAEDIKKTLEELGATVELK
ncbi:50S ribosomal protein L7/L12 [Candidatus Phytoplasma fraxini]|uniref:Large ribosomal subunit protein bL12 n=1 Tax=Ash yellows phytoplasma TaxID=35780 RepID=A0ABZ2U8M9_ASHYP